MPSLLDHNGKRLDVTATPFAEGGEAYIHSVVRQPGQVAKLYKPGIASKTRLQKLHVMIANAPNDPTRRLNHISIAWPSAVLFDAHRRFVGFTMPRIDLTRSVQVSRVWLPKVRHNALTWKHLLRIGRNLASTVAAVHARGHVVGDINERNILVSSNALVTLVDCDSMQVVDPASGRTFRCEHGVAEFTPPELMGFEFSSVDRNEAHDRFGLAVALFHLLMDGRHPFGNSANPTIAQNIQQNKAFVTSPAIQPPTGTPPLDMLPSTVQNMFIRCFEDGYRNPARRPSAAEWGASLKALERALVRCSHDPNHWYSSHRNHCPWCELSSRRVTRPTNHASGAAQQPLPRVTNWTRPGPPPPAPQSPPPAPQPPPPPRPRAPRQGGAHQTAPSPAASILRGAWIVLRWLALGALRTLGFVLARIWSLVPRQHRDVVIAITFAAIFVVGIAPRIAPFNAWSRAGETPPVISDPGDTTPDESTRDIRDDAGGLFSESNLATGLITLPRGTHHLSTPLVIDRPLRIEGSGVRTTSLVFTGDGSLLTFVGPGTLSIADTALIRQTPTAGNVVTAESGSVEITRARLSGASAGQGYSGAALSLAGHSHGALISSTVENSTLGVLVSGDATARIVNSTVQGNTHGLYFASRSSGTIERSTIQNNTAEGIILTDDSRTQIEYNTIKANGARGLSYLQRSHGTATGNTVTENGFGAERTNYWQGIGVQDQAAPVLVSNTVTNNAGVGIHFLRSAAGAARDNTVSGNGANRDTYLRTQGLTTVNAGGIVVGFLGRPDHPTPILESNRVTRNVGGDIVDYRIIAATIRPSFDCSLATTWSEQAICRSDELAALDLSLAASYDMALERLEGVALETLRVEQRAWLREREACERHADQTACLHRTIQDRTLELDTHWRSAGG